MSQARQNSHIQVKLPGTDRLQAFPTDEDTRFSDLFRALIAKGQFTAPQNEHAVWVLLCGDQDMVTWNSADNAFFDRFSFGEPPIVNVPGWTARSRDIAGYTHAKRPLP